jgi:hypothetical protein
MNTPDRLCNYRLIYQGKLDVTAWSEDAARVTLISQLPAGAHVAVEDSRPVITLEAPDDDE